MEKKKLLLFTLMTFGIVASGLLNCDCLDFDFDPNFSYVLVPLEIELTAAQETISADDSVDSTITITARVTGDGDIQEGEMVSFEVTAKTTDPVVSVEPKRDVTDANGEATAELSAGTKTGKIVVKAMVDSESDEITVTVTAGAPVGIIEGPIGVLPCPEPVKITFTAQLADAFGNDAGQAGVSVSFTADASGPVTLTPTADTDGSGQATAELILAGGVTAQVTATHINEVTFDMVTGGDPLLMPPTAEEIESEPSFRTNTLIIDPDPTDNKLAPVLILTNEDFNGAMVDGTINLIYAARGLTEVTGTNPFMFVGLTGLCGYPGAVEDCTGVETEYYIDPDSLDDCGYPLIFAKGTVIDGELSVSLGELILGFLVEGDIIPLKLCDVEVAGKVKADLSEITGDIVEGTYCPAGCASLSGFLTVDELCILVDAALGEGMCDMALGLLGDTDGDCSGEPAYSMRLLFKANEIDLFEAP